MKNHVEITLQNLIKRLRLKVAANTIYNYLQTHPAYPSLASISDALHQWNIPNLAVQLDLADLTEVTYPILAHLQTDTAVFVVVTQFSVKEIHYIHPSLGNVKETIAEFEKKWTGVALLVEKNTHSGEKDWKKTQQQHFLKKIKWFGVATIALLLFAFPFFTEKNTFFSTNYWLLLALKTIGILTTYNLVKLTLGGTSKFADAVCTRGKKTSCANVLQSKAAFLLPGISFSELGILYFIGGFLNLWLGVFTVNTSFLLWALAIMSVVGVLYSFFSLCYQAFVIRQWCPLCVLVQIVFWLELGVTYPFLLEGIPNISLTSLYPILIGFGAPLIGWVLIKPILKRSIELSHTAKKLKSFQYNSQIFMSLLQEQPPVNTALFSTEMQLGDVNAKTTLTIITNPSCKACKKAHQEIEHLLHQFPEGLQIVFRFVPFDDLDETGIIIIKTLLSYVLKGESQKAFEALSAWFKNQNLKKWQKQYQTSYTIPEVTQLFEAHLKWCEISEVIATPSFFLNGYKVPEQYSLPDLSVHIRNLIASLEQ